MKRLFMCILAVAGMIAAASCNKAVVEDQLPDGDEVSVVFSIEVPDEIVTKAEYSDGTKATDLYYAVYDSQDPNKRFLFGITDPLKFENGSLTKEVEIKLVKNYAYDIVFWAQAPGAPYGFDQANATITVLDKYTNFANDDSRDAFYQIVEGYKYVATPTKVDLYRPFAQINFGASDYDEVTALGLSMTSTAAFVGLPDVLNVLDGSVSGSVDSQFTFSPVPAASGEKLEINGDEDTYGYVSMNYVLAPKNGLLNSVTGKFNYNNSDIEIAVANVPYARNYRTNIIGELFSGQAQFIVEIKPIIYDFDPPYIQK